MDIDDVRNILLKYRESILNIKLMCGEVDRNKSEIEHNYFILRGLLSDQIKFLKEESDLIQASEAKKQYLLPAIQDLLEVVKAEKNHETNIPSNLILAQSCLEKHINGLPR